MTTQEKNTIIDWATVGVIISWATFWLFLLSPFGLLAWLAILVYLIIKKKVPKWYLILSAWFIVPLFAFLFSTFQYFSGTACLLSIGGPKLFYGIDRETRVESVSSGCIPIGFELFVFPANNTAIRLWTNLLGFQKGSYKGFFPTEDEAVKIIESADTINVQEHGQFLRFLSDRQNIELDASNIERLQSFEHYKNPLTKVIGKTINQECFVFQCLDTTTEERKTIYLVDIKQNKLLQTYFNSYY